MKHPDPYLTALLLLRSGQSLSSVAEQLPNRAARHGRACGVSLAHAEAIIRGGLRTLVHHVLADRRGPYPDELWPPESVRSAVKAARRGPDHVTARRILRGWLEGGGSPACPTSEPLGVARRTGGVPLARENRPQEEP